MKQKSPSIIDKGEPRMPPMIFQWILEDVLTELIPEWGRKGHDVPGSGRRVYILRLADDTWVFATTLAAADDWRRDERVFPCACLRAHGP